MHEQQKIFVLENLEAASKKGAELFSAYLKQAVQQKRNFSLALSGGSTPKKLYEILAARTGLPWKDVHFFWGDERCVPPDNPESNYRMAFDTLLSKINLNREQLHRMPGELQPETGALHYEKELHNFFKTKEKFPQFDLILLGLGNDGHTASLFPETPALNETQRWVTANFAKSKEMFRLTLTAPVINHAKHILFLVSGEEKAAMVKQVLHGAFDPNRWPAQLIKPVHGSLIWLLDRAAANLVEE